jgi:hypothetical protein
MPWDAPFFERELMASSSISMELFSAFHPVSE